VPQRVSKARIELKPTQERVLAALAGDGSGRLTRGRYEDIAGVSRSQAAYDLAELVDAGILERVGGGRATTYRLVRRGRAPGQRHWTNERIHAALVDFCAGRESWPSASEFKADGRSDLYVAASRYGGIGFWATKLGFAQPSRTTPAPQPVVRSWRPRLRWAAGGAAFAAALLTATGTAVYLGRDASDWLTRETGCTFGFAMFQLHFVPGLFRQAAAIGYMPMGEILPSDTGAFAMGVRGVEWVASELEGYDASAITTDRHVISSVGFERFMVAP